MPITPRILDSKGQVLEIGSQVERVLPNGDLGGIPGLVSGIHLGLNRVGVTFSPRRRSHFRADRLRVVGRTYRCSDLTLITDDEKGDGDGTGS